MLVTKFARPNHSTDQDFRDFVTAVRTGFTDLGWIRTSDTGQIDPTTVLRPAASSAVQGYDIFRLADTLQATAPFFVKVEYGSGSSQAYHALWFQVGTTTTGAGILGGNTGTRTQVAVGVTDTTPRTCLFAGGPNRMAMTLFMDVPTTTTKIAVLERSHADDGTDTNERLDTIFQSGTSSAVWQQVPTLGIVRSTMSVLPALVPMAGASGMKGTDIGMFPIFAPNDGPLRNPLIGMMLYVSSDLPSLNDFPISMYGTSRTYRTIGIIAGSGWGNGGSSVAPLMLVS